MFAHWSVFTIRCLDSEGVKFLKADSSEGSDETARLRMEMHMSEGTFSRVGLNYTN